MTQNIFLIGMPASGKSTLGRQLAKLLSYEFIDLDARIEIAENLTITEIFTLKGEDYFRKIESLQLKKIQKDTKAVIATGGGVPCFFDNMDFIKKTGISIFLNVLPSQLMERMRITNKKDRPLFNTESQNLLNTLTEKYNNRQFFYKQADITVEGETDANTILWMLETALNKPIIL